MPRDPWHRILGEGVSMYPTQLETFVALIGQVQRFLAPVDLRDRAIGATEDEPADGKRQLVATSAA